MWAGTSSELKLVIKFQKSKHFFQVWRTFLPARLRSFGGSGRTLRGISTHFKVVNKILIFLAVEFGDGKSINLGVFWYAESDSGIGFSVRVTGNEIVSFACSSGTDSCKTDTGMSGKRWEI